MIHQMIRICRGDSFPRALTGAPGRLVARLLLCLVVVSAFPLAARAASLTPSDMNCQLDCDVRDISTVERSMIARPDTLTGIFPMTLSMPEVFGGSPVLAIPEPSLVTAPLAAEPGESSGRSSTGQ